MADYLSFQFLTLADKARFNGRIARNYLQLRTVFDSRKVTHWIIWARSKLGDVPISVEIGRSSAADFGG